MLVLGIIMIVIGAGAYIWAKNMQDSFEYSWYAMWGSSDYEYVDVILYIGIFLLIVGAVIFILGCTKKISQSNNKEVPMQNVVPSYNQQLLTCKQCGAQMSTSMAFCPQCGAKKDILNQPEPNNSFCGFCGEKISSDEKFCHSCGNIIT